MLLRPGGSLTRPKMPPEWEGSQNQATYGSDTGSTGSLLKEDAAAAEVPPVSQK